MCDVLRDNTYSEFPDVFLDFRVRFTDDDKRRWFYANVGFNCRYRIVYCVNVGDRFVRRLCSAYRLCVFIDERTDEGREDFKERYEYRFRRCQRGYIDVTSVVDDERFGSLQLPGLL